MSVSSAPSPILGHGDKDKLKLAVEKEEEEERLAKVARDKKPTKA